MTEDIKWAGGKQGGVSMARFRINLAPSNRGEIFIDDKDISNSCIGLSLNAGVGKMAILTLDLSGEIEIMGDADISLRLPDGRIFPVKSGE